MGQTFVVRVAKPIMSVLRKDGRYFVTTQHQEYTYRGSVPIWVQTEVGKGRAFFVIRITHGEPEFLSLASKEKRW